MIPPKDGASSATKLKGTKKNKMPDDFKCFLAKVIDDSKDSINRQLNSTQDLERKTSNRIKHSQNV